MIQVTYNNKIGKIPAGWKEITIEQACKVSELKIPEDVADSFDWFKHLDVVKQAIKIMTTIQDVDQIDPASLVHVFTKYLLKYIVDLHSPAPQTYKPELIEWFKHDGVVYLMPTNLEIGVNIVLQHGQTVKSFIEASNLMKQFATLKSDGLKAMPLFIASIVKLERGETFDEIEIAKRGEAFNTLPMSVAWEVFFCISQLIIKYGSVTLQSMMEKESLRERIIKKLVSRLGALRLQRAELLEQLKTSTV